MKNILFTPPIAFSIIFIFCYCLSMFLSRFAFSVKDKKKGSLEPYACGEDKYDHTAQPDYSQFFPFAFFFTIAHVATLILATVPSTKGPVFALALIYILAVVTSLTTFLKK